MDLSTNLSMQANVFENYFVCVMLKSNFKSIGYLSEPGYLIGNFCHLKGLFYEPQIIHIHISMWALSYLIL